MATLPKALFAICNFCGIANFVFIVS